MQKLGLMAETNTETCCHHWMIDPVAGAESRGHCSLCGQQRTFLNVFEDVLEAQEAARPNSAAAA
jgi:hypothetical protein